MSKTQFDVDIANGVAIEVLTKYFQFGGWRYTLLFWIG